MAEVRGAGEPVSPDTDIHVTNGHANGTHANGTPANGTHANGTHVNGDHANGTNVIARRPHGSPANGSSVTSLNGHSHHLEREFPSIVEIKKRIPPHCFESSLPRSLYYVLKDLALVGALYLLAECSLRLLPAPCQLLLAPLYWYVQGTLFFAIFVLGHDCGHGSFSSSDLLNDCLGTLLHTVLMVPYFGWKMSHRNHHKNTGNIDKDEIFYPVRDKACTNATFLPGFGLGFAWYAYLVRGYSPRNVNHFNPLEPLYRRHVLGVTLSVAALLAWVYLLCCYGQWAGWDRLLFHYVLPDFVFASHLVVTTFLHHSDTDVPWYSDPHWDYVRGQLSSVDRHYGWCHNLIHNIGTHQIHHLFPKVPHYHLEEATAHFRRAFPELVQKRDERILPAFWRMFKKFSKQYLISREALIHVYK